MKKKFLITIDTEGDNLWGWRPGDDITTENAKHLLRFQHLCDEYGFKPTYLTNYEMASDNFFVDYFSKAQQQGRCEIGMHLHAFYNPPDEYCLTQRTDGKNGQAYLIEYPSEIMEKKISFLTDFILDKFGVRPISHRAGRWATNEEYFRLLDKYGYIVDCSVTPLIDWTKHAGFSPDSGGSDYTEFDNKPYRIPNTKVIELPMTIVKDHKYYKPERLQLRSVLGNVYRAIKGGEALWMRPNGYNLQNMLWISDYISRSNSGYLMFMIHSSELAPHCNPRFKSEDAIEKLYSDIVQVFAYVSKRFEGETIGNYAKPLRLYHKK